jgi:hypothetical protein
MATFGKLGAATDVWDRYLRAVRRLNDVARRIAALGAAQDLSRAELASIDELAREHADAERSVTETLREGLGQLQKDKGR